jgi:hypothetical protein
MTLLFVNVPYKTEHFQAFQNILTLPTSEVVYKYFKGFGRPYIEQAAVGNLDIESWLDEEKDKVQSNRGNNMLTETMEKHQNSLRRIIKSRSHTLF